jgi:hypothetical protein
MMFQIATVVAIASRHNESYQFSLEGQNFPQQQPKHYVDNIFRKLDFTGRLTPINYIEPQFSFSPIVHHKQLCLSGYFQSEKYFQSKAEDIKYIFSPSKDWISDVQSSHRESVSVHVRRGDYLHLPNHHPCCTLDYYNEALQQFPNSKIVIFSDDIEWCKKQFDSNYTFIQGQSDYDDLWTMSKCDHHIIANSSFSWWGAWLGHNPHKTVIAPKNWFGKNLKHNTNDLYPDEWVTI